MNEFDLEVWKSKESDVENVERSFSNFCNFYEVDNKQKSRVWWFIIYPEHYSSRADMLNRFINLDVPFVLSPLHDKDKFSDDIDSRYKKAHYHLVLCFSGPTTPKQVQDILTRGGIEWGFGLGTNCIIQDNIVNDKIGAIKYIIHSGWDEKFQYSADDMIFFNEDKQIILLNTYSETEAFNMITDIIDKEKFYEYADLIKLLENKNPTLLLYTIKRLGAPVTAYLKSKKRIRDKNLYQPASMYE